MVFIHAIVALITTLLSTFISILPFDFEGLAPWITDFATNKNATIVASSPVFPSPWTDEEIYINMSTVVVPLSSPFQLWLSSSVISPSVLSPVASSAAVSSPSVSSPPFSSATPSAPVWKPKEPLITEQLYNLFLLIQKAILKATVAVNGFILRHNLVQPAIPRVTLSWTWVSYYERQRQERLALFRLLRSERLRRQPKRRHQWIAPEIKAEAPPPPPPPGPPPTLAHLAAVLAVERLRRQVADMEKKLEASRLANEKLEELVNELGKAPVAPDPISPRTVTASAPSVSPPSPVPPPPPSIAVSYLKATAPDFRSVSASSSASSVAVSCYNATAPEFRPATFAIPTVSGVSRPQATAPIFRPAAPLAPHLRFPATGPPPPKIVQPVYGAQYDAVSFQHQQQQLQLERERRALALRMQRHVLPADPEQATEIFRRQFPNHGKKA